VKIHRLPADTIAFDSNGSSVVYEFTAEPVERPEVTILHDVTWSNMRDLHAGTAGGL